MSSFGLRICNFRSFGTEGGDLPNLGRINILIGKNNCGKSNVLRLICRTCANAFDPVLDVHPGEVGQPRTWLTVDLARAPFFDEKAQAVASTLDCGVVELRLSKNSEELRESVPEQIKDANSQALERLFRAFYGKGHNAISRPGHAVSVYEKLCRKAVDWVAQEWLKNVVMIPESRRVSDTAESKSKNGLRTFNGASVIKSLFQMKNFSFGQDEQEVRYRRIEQLICELLGESAVRLHVPHSADMLLVGLRGAALRPLESFGSGIHQLVVLCAATVIEQNAVYCIEEPEISMHPALQRALVRFLQDGNDNNTYFITTHSNAFLDAADKASVYHVMHDGTRSTVRRVIDPNSTRRVLDDLGYHASDLLQTNGVIWVEGPSDRVYLLNWLRLAGCELIENDHFSFMYYGGKVLAHYTGADAEPDTDPSEFIELLKINRHAFLVMDRDGDSNVSPLNKTKLRIQSELGDDRVWITQGREVENYLTQRVISAVIADRGGGNHAIPFGPNESLEVALDGIEWGEHKRVRLHPKVEFARDACEAMTDQDLECLDIRANINRLMEQMASWNPRPRAPAERPRNA